MKTPILVVTLTIALSGTTMAQDLDDDDRGLIRSDPEMSEANLAQELSNPVAPIISVPLQFNYNRGLGDGDGKRYGVTISPVVPFQLSDDWNLISRTVIPIVRQDEVTPNGKSQFGFGPVVQSLFFSPITDSDFIWGAGPVLALPTATSGLPGDEWGGENYRCRIDPEWKLDGRRVGEPHLVDHGRQYVEHLHPALCRLYYGDGVDLPAQYGVDL